MIRFCIDCGEEFEARGDMERCADCHRELARADKRLRKERKLQAQVSKARRANRDFQD